MAGAELSATPLGRASVTFSGDRLRAVRQKRGISQAQLAEAIGAKNLDVIRRWERGLSEPSGSMVLRLLLALNLRPAQLWLREPAARPRTPYEIEIGAAVTALSEGATTPAAAATVGISVHTLRHHLHRLGIQPDSLQRMAKPVVHDRLPADRLQALIDAGRTDRQIVEESGLSYRSVRRMIDAYRSAGVLTAPPYGRMTGRRRPAKGGADRALD